MAEQESLQRPMPHRVPAGPISREKMRTLPLPSSLDLRAPTIMVSSLVMGIAAAIAHDRFYAAHDDKPVNDGLQQKIIHNVGAAFAIMVKMFLAISTGVVFTQYLWVSLAEKPETIDQIDGLFAILGNALEFRRLTLWARHWLLGLLALITWCLPIAAVFTPGTISVRTVLRYDDQTLSTPPQPQQSWYSNQTYATTIRMRGTMVEGPDGNPYPIHSLLDSPSAELSRVAIASASQEAILPIQSSLENATYSLSFFAPAINCEPVSVDQISVFNASLTHAYAAYMLPGAELTAGSHIGLQGPSVRLLYNAWVVRPRHAYADIMRDLSDPDWNNETLSTSPDYNNTEYFYLASAAEPTGMILLSCALHNATYELDLNYQNSHQSIIIRSVNLSNEVTMGAAEADYGIPVLPTDDHVRQVYNAILFAFNNIVIASATTSDDYASTRYTGGSAYASRLRQYIEGGSNSTTAELQHVLEELFQNITISTLSSPSFRLPDDKAVQMKITTWRSQNVYVYEAIDLYIAYGSAVACTMICVLYGCYILYRSQASYKIDFSTILRTTRCKQFDELVPFDARTGNAPIPRQIKTTYLIYMKGSDSKEGGFVLIKPASDLEDLANSGIHEYAEVGSQEISQIWEHDSMTTDAALDESTVTVRRQIRRKPVATNRTS